MVAYQQVGLRGATPLQSSLFTAQLATTPCRPGPDAPITANIMVQGCCNEQKPVGRELQRKFL